MSTGRPASVLPQVIELAGSAGEVVAGAAEQLETPGAIGPGNGSIAHTRESAVDIVVYAAYDRRLVNYRRALTVVSYGTFLDAGLHVLSDSIAMC